MPTEHIVLRGDCFSSLAKDYGFENYHTVYDDAKNAALKARRPNPNTLEISDRIFIPDKRPMEIKKDTGAKHSFVLKKKSVKLRLVFLGPDDAPLASREFEIFVSGAKPRLTTNGQGWLEIDIAANLKDGDLHLRVVPAARPPSLLPAAPSVPYPPPIHPAEFTDAADSSYTGRAPELIEWTLEIGALASFNTVRGVRSRLWNLGFNSGGDGAVEDLSCQAAVRNYQAKHKLPETGKAADIEAHLRHRHDIP